MRGRGFLLQVMNGVVAAHYGAQLIINAIAEKGYAHVILATGSFQFEMLQVDGKSRKGRMEGWRERAPPNTQRHRSCATF
jgi:hypothetical protein